MSFGGSQNPSRELDGIIIPAVGGGVVLFVIIVVVCVCIYSRCVSQARQQAASAARQRAASADRASDGYTELSDFTPTPGVGGLNRTPGAESVGMGATSFLGEFPHSQRDAVSAPSFR